MPHFRAHNWKIFPKPCACTFTSGSFIDSFSFGKKRCNISQGFGAFFGQSCDRDRFLFPFIPEFLSFFFLFLDFIAISDCVFNNKNHYVLGHTGYQIIITILVISTLNANLRVATRVYDVEGGAIFSKIAHLSFSMGPRGPRAYGLRPRLWLLLSTLVPERSHVKLVASVATVSGSFSTC